MRVNLLFIVGGVAACRTARQRGQVCSTIAQGRPNNCE